MPECLRKGENMDYPESKLKGVKKRKILNIEQWKLSPFTRQIKQYIHSAVMITKVDCDPVIKLLIREEHQSKLTPQLHDRLLAYLREFYDVILLVEIETPDQYEKLRRQELLTQAKKEQRRKEKEYKRTKLSAKKTEQDNFLSVG